MIEPVYVDQDQPDFSGGPMGDLEEYNKEEKQVIDLTIAFE